jgi:hypothetical protein
VSLCQVNVSLSLPPGGPGITPGPQALFRGMLSWEPQCPLITPEGREMELVVLLWSQDIPQGFRIKS